MSLLEEQHGRFDPTSALGISQKADLLLARSAPVNNLSPLTYVTSSEAPETWTDLEKLVVACLQTGDDKNAFFALERLVERFGAENERVMGLRGLYQEAVAKDIHDLQKVVEVYNKTLKENPMNVPVHKRRIAVMRSLKRDQEAADALVDFLDAFPTDVEAWGELSDVYVSQGFSSQAIFCLEEALLGAPNAWNLHARLGEVEYMVATSDSDGAETRRKHLTQSIRRFGRSIELCDNYLRGYYGLALATSKLLETGANAKTGATDTIPQETAQGLNAMAMEKLSHIVKTWSKQSQPGIDESEIIAAKELLNRAKR